jgi:NAD(P)-dependent dehydrogenase (short-subunit alcohol dehydrogenase family)
MNEIIKTPADFQAQPNCLKDKIILVTGASDGIGAVVAKTFAEYGATVILLGKTEAKLVIVYDDIVNSGYPQPAIITLDLESATPDQYAELAYTIEKEFDHLDGLLHNAAMFGSLIPITQFDTDLWEKITKINLHAPFLLSKALIPLLNKSQDASMIFTSSRVAQKGSAYWGAYGVTKAASDNLMGILADELEINTPIRVNSIDPGKIRTRMRALAYPGEDPMTVPAPEEIMNNYLYLMSAESKDVNGKIINCRKN